MRQGAEVYSRDSVALQGGHTRSNTEAQFMQYGAKEIWIEAAVINHSARNY